MLTTYHFELKKHPKSKTNKKINTRLHYEYICREGKYEKLKDNYEETLDYKKSGNLPSWANNDPKTYWETVEQNRLGLGYKSNKQARGYAEFIIALQNSLTLEENIECIETFLKETTIYQDHTFTYVIHEKHSLGNYNIINLHTHIMFDEHIIEHDRPITNPILYFKRYSKDKYGNLVGGYKKDRYFNKKEFLLNCRKIWANTVNEIFKRKGFKERISHKSLKEQKDELIQKNMPEEAKFYDRVPIKNLKTNSKNPIVRQRIKEKISQFKNKLPETIDTEKMNQTEKLITLYAYDYVKRYNYLENKKG